PAFNSAGTLARLSTEAKVMARRPDHDLDGALALVTGAARGIGRTTAVELARRGARVLAVDVDAPGAEKAAVACAEVGPDAHGLVCDVADLDDVRALAERVHRTWGPLDIL